MMTFYHGSQSKINDGEFCLFDYKRDVEGNPIGGVVASGADAHGPGIYAFQVEADENGSIASSRKNAIEGARFYAGENGYVHELTVDIEPHQLMDARSIDELAPEELTVLVEEFIEMRRDEVGYSAEKIEELLYEHQDEIDIEILDHDEFLANAKKADPRVDWDSADFDPRQFATNSEWEDSVRENYESLYDPAMKIYEEGGPEAVAEYAYQKSDTVWDAIKYTWEQIAFEATGKGDETWNATFLQAAQQTICRDHDLVATRANYGGFAVIFDPSEIKVKKIYEIEPLAPEYDDEGPSP